MDFPDHPFWDFSIEVHRRAGPRPAFSFKSLTVSM